VNYTDTADDDLEELALAVSDDGDDDVGNYKPPPRPHGRRIEKIRRKGQHYLDLISTALSKRGGNIVHVQIDNHGTPEPVAPVPPLQQQQGVFDDLAFTWMTLMWFVLGVVCTFAAVVIVFTAFPLDDCGYPVQQTLFPFSSSSSSSTGVFH
jgi:hypothetical protein